MSREQKGNMPAVHAHVSNSCTNFVQNLHKGDYN